MSSARERTKELVSAIANPLSLAVAAVGGATFGLSGIWWLLPATAAAMGAVAASQFRFNRTAQTQLKEPYAERERELLALMDRIDQALADAHPSIRSSLPGIEQQLKAMRAKVGPLLKRQSRIDEFLLGFKPGGNAAELRRLEQSLASALTEDAREKFRSALNSKQGQIEAQNDLHATSERIAAELAELQAALENSLSRIVSLEHTHGSSLQADSAGITAQLGDVLITIQALEQALTELHDPARQRQRRSEPGARP